MTDGISAFTGGSDNNAEKAAVSVSSDVALPADSIVCLKSMSSTGGTDDIVITFSYYEL